MNVDPKTSASGPSNFSQQPQNLNLTKPGLSTSVPNYEAERPYGVEGALGRAGFLARPDFNRPFHRSVVRPRFAGFCELGHITEYSFACPSFATDFAQLYRSLDAAELCQSHYFKKSFGFETLFLLGCQARALPNRPSNSSCRAIHSATSSQSDSKCRTQPPIGWRPSGVAAGKRASPPPRHSYSGVALRKWLASQRSVWFDFGFPAAGGRNRLGGRQGQQRKGGSAFCALRRKTERLLEQISFRIHTKRRYTKRRCRGESLLQLGWQTAHPQRFAEDSRPACTDTSSRSASYICYSLARRRSRLALGARIAWAFKLGHHPGVHPRKPRAFAQGSGSNPSQSLTFEGLTSQSLTSGGLASRSPTSDGPSKFKLVLVLAATCCWLIGCSAQTFSQGSETGSLRPQSSQTPTATLQPIGGFQPNFAKPGASSELPSTDYAPPVQGEITDFFRPPAHIGASGNRGWEYTTSPNSPVRAAQGGVIHFAGQIDGDFYISINHADGIKTTYSYLSDLKVAKSQLVARGELLASTAGKQFHFGVVEDNQYVDPALLFDCSAESCQQLTQVSSAKVRLIPMAS